MTTSTTQAIPANGAKPRVGKFKRPEPPKFDDTLTERRYRLGRLALACRIMAKQGWDFGCSMHFSCRDPHDSDVMFVVPAGRALSAMRSSNLMWIKISTGEVVDEGNTSYGYDLNSTAIHRAVYTARSDINGIIDGQTPNSRAFSMQQREIKMIAQDSCTYYNSIGRLPLRTGLDATIAPEAVAQCLGSNKGMIMQHRGLLLATPTIEGTVSLYIRLDSLMKGQMMAEAAAKGRGGELVL